MRKTLLSVLLLWFSFSFVSVAPFSGYAKSSAQDQVAKIKEKVAKVGTGPKARVKVTLKDGTSLKGHITVIEDERFVLVADKTATVNSINYTDVKQVKTLTDNPFSDPKVWLGLALIPAIIVIGVVAKGVD